MVGKKPSLRLISSAWRGWSIGLLALLLYVNTLPGSYVFDDHHVIVHNPAVNRGLSGLPEIFTRDMFAMAKERRGGGEDFYGNRFRPIVTGSYAVEVALFGKNPMPAHAVNVLWYVGVCLLLYAFARRLFPAHPDAVWLAALLFVVHPLHTEVVANLKSRDEMMCFGFMLAACLGWMRAMDGAGRWTLLWVGLCSLAAFWCKEYAVGLPFLMVLLWWVRRGGKFPKTALAAALAGLVFAVAWRLIFVGFSTLHTQEIASNPYAFAPAGLGWPTRFAVIFRAITLLVWPHPLVYDYSYPHIPYVGWDDPTVWLGVLLLAAWLGVTVYAICRRSPAAVSLAFGLGPFLMICNLFADSTVMLGERLLFIPTAGVLLALVPLWVRLNRRAAWALAAVLLVWGAVRVVDRNSDWQTEERLYLADEKVHPPSLKVIHNAAVMYLAKSREESNERLAETWRVQAEHRFRHVLSMQKNNFASKLSLGQIALDRGDLDTAHRIFTPLFPRAPRHHIWPITLGRLATGLQQRAKNRLAADDNEGAWQDVTALFCLPIADDELLPWACEMGLQLKGEAVAEAMRKEMRQRQEK